MVRKADNVATREGPAPPEAASLRSLLDELMTAREIADILQLRVSTVEDYARRGLLPSLKLGRHRRFVRSQVEELIASLVEERAMAARASSLGGRFIVAPRQPRRARD
jgi:excisionase family DNA binding protein